MAAGARATEGFDLLPRDGGVIAYRSFGSGAPLFVLNGGPGRSSDTFVDLSQKLASRLARRVILFDQRGTGRSHFDRVDESTVTLDLMVDDLEALRARLGFEKIAIFGHSFGGMYAMAYAAKHPERVEWLALSCSGGVDLSWQSYAQHNMLSRLTLEERQRYVYWTSEAQTQLDPEKADREATRVLVPAYLYRREFVPQIERDLTRFGSSVINQLVWKSMAGLDLRSPLKRVQARALVMDCRQDILGEEVPMKIRDAIPHAELTFLDECGHYPFIEAPEAYFARIEAFARPTAR